MTVLGILWVALIAPFVVIGLGGWLWGLLQRWGILP